MVVVGVSLQVVTPTDLWPPGTKCLKWSVIEPQLTSPVLMPVHHHTRAHGVNWPGLVEEKNYELVTHVE